MLVACPFLVLPACTAPTAGGDLSTAPDGTTGDSGEDGGNARGRGLGENGDPNSGGDDQATDFNAADFGIAELLPGIDWRAVDAGFVTDIRDQAPAQTCVLFAAVAGMESAFMIQTGESKSIDGSEQYLLDCTDAPSTGGYSISKIAADLEGAGTVAEADAPYTGVEGDCSDHPTRLDYEVQKVYYLATDEDIKAALHLGPVVTRFDVYEDLFDYTSGVYHVDGAAEYAGGHAVLIVGYSDADSAWIVKNSWGPDFGEDGFFRIGYGESAFANYGYLYQVSASGLERGLGLLDYHVAIGDADGDGWPGDNGDCDDGDAGVNPDAEELPFDGVDNDCDAIIDLAMTDISGGAFTMGGPSTEVGAGGNGESAHAVRISRDFSIGTYEVTRAEFARYIGYEPALYSGYHDDIDTAVVGIDWYEAAAFANGVSDAAGLDLCYACSGVGTEVTCELDSRWLSPYDCPGYRLPTEAEWEYAARAGTTSAFSNGANLLGDLEISADDDIYNCDGRLALDDGSLLDSIAWYCGNSTGPDTVGQLFPNSWGLYDVHGGVAEWVEDWWLDAYTTDVYLDPWGPDESHATICCGWDIAAKVARGGSYAFFPLQARSGSRGPDHPTTVSPYNGVRLARTQ